MANQVTKDTIIIDVLKMDPGTADFFIQIGTSWLARLTVTWLQNSVNLNIF